MDITAETIGALIGAILTVWGGYQKVVKPRIQRSIATSAEEYVTRRVQALERKLDAQQAEINTLRADQQRSQARIRELENEVQTLRTDLAAERRANELLLDRIAAKLIPADEGGKPDA
jgi:peptidoglycan hydrolase CwlO-like protein